MWLSSEVHVEKVFILIHKLKYKLLNCFVGIFWSFLEKSKFAIFNKMQEGKKPQQLRSWHVRALPITQLECVSLIKGIEEDYYEF